MHYYVMVIGPDVEGQLAPYQEYDGYGSCPKEYLEFVDDTEEVTMCWGFSENRSFWKDIAEFASLEYGYVTREIDGEPRYGYLENPNAHWDWYKIGGRFDKLLPTADGYRTCARKSDVRFDVLRDAAETEARVRFGRWQAALDKCPDASPPRSWDDILNEVLNEPGCRDRIAAQAETRVRYNAQPQIRAWRELCARVHELPIGDPVADLCMGQEELIARERRMAPTPYAVVKGGVWQERGNDSREMWLQWFEDMWSALPDDTLVTVVDCHI